MTGTAVSLDVTGVNKTFGGVRALSDINLQVSAAGISALIGPNGAGKTTLFNVISGFGVPYTGRVRFGDRDLTGLAPHQVARAGIVRTFQTTVGFPSMTVSENVAIAVAGSDLDTPWSAFFRWRRDRRVRAEAQRTALAKLESAGIGGLADAFLADLSPGDSKLVEIVRQLALEPSMLLLDEPAAAMAVDQIDTLSGIIRQIAADGVGVLVIDHNLGFVLELAQTVHVLESGSIMASGTPEEIGQDERVREIYLGGAEDAHVA
jgi:ABC-type branched-subunit amino acid transport system ATPase component